MIKVFRKPKVIILVQAALILIFFSFCGRMKPILTPDSRTYIDFSFDSLKGILTAKVPFFYPLFLEGISMVSASLWLVPYVHFAFYTASVVLIYVALKRIGISNWKALVLSSTLLYSNFLFRYSQIILSDSMGLSFAICAVAFLIIAISNSASRWSWPGVIVCVFLSYQTRPAYLFLVLLIPLMGICILFIISKSLTFSRLWARFGLFLAGLTVLPLVIFCLLRFVLVGHFGIVSFDGYNVIGIAGQFLERDDLPRLPEKLSSLGASFLEHKSAASNWLPAIDKKGNVSRQNIDRMYCETVYRYSLALGKTDNYIGIVQSNKALRDISFQLIRFYKRQYFEWILKAAYYSVTVQITKNFPFVLISIIAVFLFLIYTVKIRCNDKIGDVLTLPVPKMALDLSILFIVALGFLLAKTLLVVVVEIPIDRYTDPAGIFMAFLPAYLLCSIWDLIHHKNG